MEFDNRWRLRQGPQSPDFWIAQGAPDHAASACRLCQPDDRATVDAFHRAALAAGGVRTTGADPDCGLITIPTTTAPSCSIPTGNNIEAVRPRRACASQR
jgi:hypothetical protein